MDSMPASRSSLYAVLCLVMSFGSLSSCSEDASAPAPPAGPDPRILSDVNWQPFPMGVNAMVTDLAEFDGRLYADMGIDLGVGFYRGLEYWDGRGWRTVGMSGAVPGINGLYVGGGYLYAVGTFDGVAGANSKNIVRYDGTFWTGLSPSGDMNGPVHAVTEFGGDVIVGGTFNQINAAPYVHIARWSTSGWSTVSGGMRDTGISSVLALASTATDVYAGGRFDEAGGVAAPGIARWDGSAWHALAEGVTNKSIVAAVVSCIAIVDRDLYAAGRFDRAGGVDANNIAYWDGSTWTSLGAGVDSQVNAIAFHQGLLYVGGDFNRAGDLAANHVAMWDGSEWYALGQGANSTVHAISEWEGNVCIGGLFGRAGGKLSRGVAIWLPPDTTN